MRNQKTLSLNLKTREAERKRQDSERLARENAWRAAHNVPPAKSLEEIKDDAAAGSFSTRPRRSRRISRSHAAHKVGPTQARRTDLH